MAERLLLLNAVWQDVRPIVADPPSCSTCGRAIVGMLQRRGNDYRFAIVACNHDERVTFTWTADRG